MSGPSRKSHNPQTPHTARNPYTDGPLTATFIKTALPIILVMTLNGLLTVTDALILGHCIGGQALAAVTTAFPLSMTIIALAVMVSGGMASILARSLGAGQIERARTLYASAHWLALAVCGALMALYGLFGHGIVTIATGNDPVLTALALPYLRGLVIFSPCLFLLSVNTDALRNEGHVGFMAVSSILVTLGNMAFTLLFVAVLDQGTAGAAYGTVLAQAVALGLVTIYRYRCGTLLRPDMAIRRITMSAWPSILSLGAPQSLNFIGIALSSSALLAVLQVMDDPQYAVTVTAYGIASRVMTLAILPLIGLSQAMQALTGNNYGAGLARRAEGSLWAALVCSALFCAAIQISVTLFAQPIGLAFVSDPQVVAKTAAILPVVALAFVISGPLMMVAAHFQAIGDARRAALLGMSKPYLFVIPLVFTLPFLFGEDAVWWATPMAEGMLLVLTTVVLWRTARRVSLRQSLFGPHHEEARP